MIPDLRIDAEPSPAAQQLGRPAAPQVEESKETWHFVPIRTAKKINESFGGYFPSKSDTC